MNLIIPFKIEFKKNAARLMFFVMLAYSTNTYAGLFDTTIFRIKVIQDSVYAGDTVDVDIYIGDPRFLLVINPMKEFKLEMVTDSALIEQDNINFEWDSLSLTNFFSTTISNLTAIANVDPFLGNLLMNCKTNTINLGQGNARVGRGKYIVQDNAAGRQFMPFGFSTAISKDLLGLNNPVKLIIDSVLILGPRTQIPTAIKNNKSNNIKISPNPLRDFIYIDGENVQQYKLINLLGTEIFLEKQLLNNKRIDLRNLNSGTYILMLQINGVWNNYKIIKE